MAARIYTKSGDTGETALVGGSRVSKSSLRVEAYGNVDELNAALGCVLAFDPPEELAGILTELQASLFELGAQLATPTDAPDSCAAIAVADVERLERSIDEIDSNLEPIKSFILPGGLPVAASLQMARAICRRAERSCVALREAESDTATVVVTYLNRLSDLLFVMARWANLLGGCSETLWNGKRKP